MTDLDIAPSAAGWYPDPEGMASSRFWDGAAWTVHVKGGPARSGPPTASTAIQSGHIAPMVGVPRNGMATAALVLGSVSLLFNLLLIPTILGIVFGAVGAARAAYRGGVGRVRAIVGIVLSAVGVVALGVQAAIAIPIYLAAQQSAQIALIRSTVINDAAAKHVEITDVRCPPSANLRTPGSFTCDAQSSTGQRYAIAITVERPGYWSWAGEAVH